MLRANLRMYPNMKKFHVPKSKIHVIARAILFQGDDIVLCRPKGKKWLFLPGGHVENGETVRQALVRELEEEIGSHDYQLGSFAGVCEGIFSRGNDILQQEVNFLFEVHMPEGEINSNESHIEFIPANIAALKNYDIMPAGTRELLINWIDRKSICFNEFLS